MKFSGPVLVLLLLAGAGVYYYSNTENSSPETAVRQDSVPETVPTPLPPQVGPVELLQQANIKAQAETPRVTGEQRALVTQQEEKLQQMALEYEAARANPEQREAVRAAMQQQLAIYSETVLPVAMEKMAAAQSTN